MTEIRQDTAAGISESNRIKPETGWDKSNIDVKYY
jgi:hypothetical protein